jgi:hypothetical protein
MVNQIWMKEKWGSANKFPQMIYKSDFYKDYHDLVTHLSRIMDLKTNTFFQEWMFSFIEDILYGETKFHWAKMIDQNLHDQFGAIKKISTSYLV